MRFLTITKPDINNGPGCRVTLWIPGCNRHCEDCHTPWTHDYNQGEEFTFDVFEKLCEFLKPEYISGLTISGGDPLMQNEETLSDLLQLVHDIKHLFPNKTIWIYTGYYKEQLSELQLDILKYCDVLVEGPFIKEKKDITIPFRGSTNQKITKLN